MNSVFETKDYKRFVIDFIAEMPKKGRGEFLRIAESIRVHPTMVSQIFKGPKHLTLEQACLVAEYFGMNNAETDCFLTLVEYDRAGSAKLRKRLQARLEELRRKNLEIKNRILPPNKELTDSERAIFYSEWFYSAVRLLTSIDSYQDMNSISERLNLPRQTVGEVVKFLLETGLCVTEGHSVKMGPQRTHVPNDSPFFRAHLMNWRLFTMNKIGRQNKDDLFFTAPFTASKADIELIKEEVRGLIAGIAKKVDQSTSEDLVCFNVDVVRI
ncbi:MAG: TIGR02147 family protein [Oligoflexales bacterium]